MLMFNLAHAGHPHVDGAPHVSGEISTAVVLIIISIFVVTLVIAYQLKNKK